RPLRQGAGQTDEGDVRLHGADRVVSAAHAGRADDVRRDCRAARGNEPIARRDSGIGAYYVTVLAAPADIADRAAGLRGPGAKPTAAGDPAPSPGRGAPGSRRMTTPDVVQAGLRLPNPGNRCTISRGNPGRYGAPSAQASGSTAESWR